MVNKVIIVGNVGSEPEVRSLDGGRKVTTLRIATSETYVDKFGEKQERTEWHNVVLWNALADVVEKYVHKGSQLFIEGSLRTRKYEVAGDERWTTEILADTIKLLGRAKDANDLPV